MNAPKRDNPAKSSTESTNDVQNQLECMVFTDLDGTLLDHHSYAFEPAIEGIEALQALQIPIAMCTSKTLSECLDWQHKIPLNGPIVYENGAGIAIPINDLKTAPQNTFEQTTTHYLCGDSLPYEQIREKVVALRSQHGYDFLGYGDFSVEDVMRVTGLSQDAAELSKIRHHTEPLLWSDSEAAKQAFIGQVESLGLMTLQGGRFLHVTSYADKGSSMLATAKHYVDLQSKRTRLIALGDSPNDTAMLSKAHAAVIIRRHDSSWMPYTQTQHNQTVIQTQGIGPVGWSEAILKLVNAVTTNNKKET